MGRTFLSPLLLNYLSSAPSAPPSNHLGVYAKSGGVLYTQNSAGAERLVTPGIVLAFSVAGALAVTTGQHRIYNDVGQTLTIWAVRASVGTAPVGASVIVDVNIGPSPTTIFTTQANRPTIAAGTNSNKSTSIDVMTISDGGFFTVDIDQVGSTTPGSDLTVQILCR